MGITPTSLHDGTVHHVHGDHVDVATDAAAHVAHAGHMHVHENGCGHAVVAHGDHLDYVHGEHRHTGHHVHYDEPGIADDFRQHLYSFGADIAQW